MQKGLTQYLSEVKHERWSLMQYNPMCLGWGREGEDLYGYKG